MDVKEEAVKSAIGKLVALALVLIGLLLLAAWRVFLSGVWARVEVATPKQGLEVLLGLAGIAICLLAGALIDSWRKNHAVPPKPVRKYGVHWDPEFNPLCPVCDVLMRLIDTHTYQGQQVDLLHCPKCNVKYYLKDDRGFNVRLLTAKQQVRFENSN